MRDRLLAKTRHVLAVVALASLFLAGCSPAASNTGNASGAEILAKFKGGDVTRAEFDEQLQASAQQSGGNLPSEGDPQYKQLVAQVMPQLVSAEIAKAYADENGITVSEKDVDQEIKRLKSQVGDQARSQGRDISNEKAYRQALEQAGFTEDELRSNIREQLPLQKVQQRVAGDVSPSDKEVRSYYDENKGTFAEPETRCASHILFSPDQEEKAKEVKEKLEDGGDFAALAKKYSQDPGTADKGGDLGCQPETNPQTGQPTYAPAFNDALFAKDAEEGDVIGPIKTEFGYHVIKLKEIRPKSTPPFEEVQGRIRDQLTQQARSEKLQKWLDEQRQQRNVRYKRGYDPQAAAPSGTTSSGTTSSGTTGGG